MNPQFYRSRPKPADVPTGRDYWIKADPDGVVRDMTTEEEAEQKRDDAQVEVAEIPSPEDAWGAADMRWVDVGCGVGHLLGGRLSWVGVEPDPWSATMAKRRTGCRVVAGTADIQDAWASGVLCYHVIEHVEEPVPFAQELHRILRPERRLVISTPDFGSPVALRWGPRFRLALDPTHISLFDTAGLRGLLEYVGFRIERVWYPFPSRFHTPENTRRLLEDDPETTISPPAPGNIVSMVAIKA